MPIWLWQDSSFRCFKTAAPKTACPSTSFLTLRWIAMMIVSFKIDWHQAAEVLSDIGKKEYDLSDISNIKGDLIIETKLEKLVFKLSTILIDMTSLIYVLSEKSVRVNQGKTLAVHIDDEPDLYVSFLPETVQLYRYSPLRAWQIPNPVIESMDLRAATELSQTLKQAITQEVAANAPRILPVFESALRA
jgi:hypothetical protein